MVTWAVLWTLAARYIQEMFLAQWMQEEACIVAM